MSMRRPTNELLALGLLVLGVAACGEEQIAEPIPDRGTIMLDALVPFDAGQPDMQRPDTRAPDTAQPDAARPDTGRPDTARPDTRLPDTASPDTGVADAATPDGAVPDAVVVDSAAFDTAAPDTTVVDMAAPDTARPDLPPPDLALPDTIEIDDAASPDTGDPCDRDGDGVQNSGCGGNDCDDDNPLRFPGNPEVCSYTDENCSGSNNEGLDCWFYAVGLDTLYRVDPFEPEVVWVADISLSGDDWALLDIDLDTNGDIVAVTYDRICVLHETGFLSTLYQPVLPSTPNGLSITGPGVLYLSTNDVGGASYVQELNRASETLTPVVALLPHQSSGDLVVFDNGAGVLSSPDPNDPVDGVDQLIIFDVDDGAKVPVGPIGYQDVWALSHSFGYLYGLTGNGEVLLLNVVTGEGLGLFTVVDGNGDRVVFYGAADAE